MPDETRDVFGQTRDAAQPGAAAPLEDGSPPPATLIQDAFTAANGTTVSGRTPSPTSIGTTWNIFGTVDVQDNAMHISNAGFGYGAWINLTTSSLDYLFDVKPGNNGNGWFLTFAGDTPPANSSRNNNGYRIFCSPVANLIALKRVSGGAETDLGSYTFATFTVAAFNELRMVHETASATIVIYFKGTEIIRVVDPSPPTLGTYVGVSASTLADNTIRLDDFDARVIEPIILDAGDEDYDDGETGIVITGLAFGSTTGTVKLTQNSDGSGTSVAQTVTAWGNNSVTFTCSKGALGTTAYLFVTDSNSTVSNGIQVSLSGASNLILLGRRRLMM